MDAGGDVGAGGALLADVVAEGVVGAEGDGGGEGSVIGMVLQIEGVVGGEQAVFAVGDGEREGGNGGGEWLSGEMGEVDVEGGRVGSFQVRASGVGRGGADGG